MSHKNLNAVVPLPVRAEGCDLLNARAEPVARAVDEQVAAALVQLINLGQQCSLCLGRGLPCTARGANKGRGRKPRLTAGQLFS